MASIDSDPPPRTPNGAVDLLSGNDDRSHPTAVGCPSHLMLNDDEEDGLLRPLSPAAPPPRAFSTRDAPSKEDGDDDDSYDGDMYARLDSFEAKLEKELQDLEEFGVRGSDPDGKGARPVVTPPRHDPDDRLSKASHRSSKASSTVSTAPEHTTADDSTSSSSWSTVVSSAVKSAKSSARKKYKNRGGNKWSNKKKPTSEHSNKRLNKLSSKTNKIMSDYQNYLAEIQTTEFSFDSDEDTRYEKDDNGGNLALANVHQAREDVRDSYFSKAEEGRTMLTMSQPLKLQKDPDGLEKDDNYATGAGKEPLQRAWNLNDNNSNDDNVPQYENLYNRVLLYGGIGQKHHLVNHNDNSQYQIGLRSKKAKQGIATIALTAFVVSMVCLSVGISNRRDDASIQVEWEAEYEDKHQHGGQEQQQQLQLPSVDGRPDWLGLVTVGLANGGQSRGSDADGGGIDADEESSSGDNPDGWRAGNWAAAEGNAEEYDYEADMLEEKELAESLEIFYSKMQQIDEDELKEDEDEFEPEQSEAPSSPDWQAETTTATKNEEQIPEEYDPYYEAVAQYRPVMYDRSTGWKGQTYREALVFCEVAAGLALCPYEAVCPLGTSGEPFGGFREAPNGDWAWVPIINGDDEWVQVGPREGCAKYSGKFGERPEWGVSGEDNEDITRNVMCCLNVHDSI